ncbi:MAG: hypothetical protein C5B57_13485 [Blastocatellia bacterium]|nr:MAG: hypothetical protein C5B57_13485 [Blastocatellia bacterium]
MSFARSQLVTMSRSRLLAISLLLSFSAIPSNRASRVVDCHSAEYHSAGERHSDADPLSPTFRLGTAARPFGWSTAIADLNTDGTPDLIIADRGSQRANTYGYLIQFSISGLELRNVSFESSQPGLTVAVSDLDHDNDLDVVVRALFSREVVGVWLNDGRGNFHQVDDRPFTSGFAEVRSIATPDAPVDLSFAGLLPPAPDGLSISFRTVTPQGPGPFRLAAANVPPATVPSAAAAPRGPPLQLA